MGKSIHFFGQSVFGQLISLIDRSKITESVSLHQSDKYCKGFYTWDHLVSMLFCTLGNCQSLREVVGACLGLKGKVEHLGLGRLPKRSTLSDANRIRNSAVFESIYHELLKKYRSNITDSRIRDQFGKEVFIIDSTTISLFQSILRCVGRKPKSGKQKGGIKVHTMIQADAKVPQVIWFSAATTHDSQFLKKVTFKKDALYLFDKGYVDYLRYEKFITEGISFVTRLKDNASYDSIEELDILEHIDPGVIKDELIKLPIRKNGQTIRTISLRRVAYWDDEQKRIIICLTNLIEVEADVIPNLYKQRWQIETLFKQLKQNFPLKYFLGDNENAIKIQVWCVLIANLLLTVIQEQIKSKKWAFSNIVSFVRLHLFNYIHLISFLENPEKDWEKEVINEPFDLFSG